MSIKVFVVQLAPKKTEKELVTTILKNIQKAEKTKCDLILFPELVFNQWGKSFPNMKHIDYKDILKDISRKCGLIIVAGGYQAIEKRIYNRTFVYKRGKLLTYYDKIFLYDLEKSANISPGKTMSTFNCKKFKIGIQTCYDIRHPEIALSYRNLGCDVILTPSAWVLKKNGSPDWLKLIKVRALDTQCYIVAADMTGKIGNISWLGKSCIASPNGNIIIQKNKNSASFSQILYKKVLKEERKRDSLFPRDLTYYHKYWPFESFVPGYLSVNKLNKKQKENIQKKFSKDMYISQKKGKNEKCREIKKVKNKLHGCFDTTKVNWQNKKGESGYCIDGDTKRNKLGSNCQPLWLCLNIPNPDVCTPLHSFVKV